MTRLTLLALLFLTGCASNAQYAEPAIADGEWYGEVSGFNIEADLWLFVIETPAVHLYINIKPSVGDFENFHKLSKEDDEGKHYYHYGGYHGYRNTEKPIITLTPEQALAVYRVATSDWAKKLAAEYHLIGHNSNGFVVKILERAGVPTDALPWGAIQ